MRIKIPQLLRRFMKATSFWQDNYFLLREFKHFRRIALLAIIFSLLAAAFEGFTIGLILSFLKSFTEPNAEPIQTGMQWIDVWILGVNLPPSERLYRIPVVILIATFCRLSFSYLGQLYSYISQIQLAYRIRLRIFEQLQALSISYFTSTRSGNLINTLTTEITRLMQALNVISVFIIRGFTLVVLMVSLLLLSWQLTIISGLLFILIAVGLSTLLRKIREVSFDITQANSLFASVSLELINGIRTVHIFAAKDFERKRFYNASKQVLEASSQARAVQAFVEPLSEGGGTIMLLSILLLGVTVLIPQGLLEKAGFFTFLFVLLRIIPIVRTLNGVRAKLSNCYGPLANIRGLLDRKDKPYMKNGQIQFTKLQREIEFVGLDFGYEPNKLVLHDISLSIAQGETVALVGSSGAGKSTLADLITRFYDPIRGKILIDGVELAKLEIDSLRRKLAVVSQDTFIFNTSVRENIAYGLTGVEEARIKQAAKRANAWEFIQELPEGLETQLGDRGVRLSGGQRQRLAIARALLRDPEILILDEATSALDSISERLIQESLEKLAAGRTVIAIAHRLSTIMRADKVVVLEQGRIVEQGTYQELLEQKGQLWQYHQMQNEVELTR
ncbi:heterocyst formation ABC transporter subunit HepA [Pleurocapsa sp. PCC 7319]|uniref:heterocyst formation ABC transporter subunit HepA n=1 Tax=Pleurocapsa sp. PCC 7319 TaxID=118161 RepID=UPI000345FCA0|nr:heterocyst formation ABC transporter subunit HepA [Pleurocapsa sp. PCC 7319]